MTPQSNILMQPRPQAKASPLSFLSDRPQVVSPPSQIVFRRVALDAALRWRCAWWDRGFGTVVARTELAGTPVSYEVELDGDEGRLHRVLPCELRAIPDIEIPAPSVPR